MLKDGHVHFSSLRPPLKKLKIVTARQECSGDDCDGDTSNALIQKLLSSIREDAQDIAQLRSDDNEMFSSHQIVEDTEPLHARMERIEQGFCGPNPQTSGGPLGKGHTSFASAQPALVGHESIISRQDRLSAGFCAPADHIVHLQPLQGRGFQHGSKAEGLSGCHASSLSRRFEAHLGHLTAESAALEAENEELEAQLKDMQADRWCVDIAKTGLEERVASLAAALVQCEGFSEALDAKCAEQEASMAALQSRLRALEAQLLSERTLHAARVARIERDLQHSRKDRKTRESLEKALSVLRCSDEAEIAGDSSGDEDASVAAVAGCWPAAFGSKKGMSRNASSTTDASARSSAPNSPEGPLQRAKSTQPDTLVPDAAERMNAGMARKSASPGPGTPGRTQEVVRQQYDPSSRQAALKAPHARAPPAPLPNMARADSAREVPSKRRAVGDAPTWSRDQEKQARSAFDAMSADGPQQPSRACIMSPTSTRTTAHRLEREWSAVEGGHPFVISPHTALSLAATPSGRLSFAHSVTPMISDIGRQLAAQYAVTFENARLRGAMQGPFEHQISSEDQADE